MEIGTEQLCKFGCSKNRCQDGIRHARYLLGEKPFVDKREKKHHYAERTFRKQCTSGTCERAEGGKRAG